MLRKLPEGYQLSDELRAQARMAGVQDPDARLASLRTGPIGGLRGVLADQLDAYVASLFGSWRLFEERERVKQRALTATHPRGNQGPSRAYPEPRAKHLRFARHYGIDLASLVEQLEERQIVEKLGTDSFYEHLEKALALEAKRRVDAGLAQPPRKGVP